MKITIISDYNKEIVSDSDFVVIEAKSKKDFYKQIDEMIKKEEITNNWGLQGDSVFCKWFAY